MKFKVAIKKSSSFFNRSVMKKNMTSFLAKAWMEIILLKLIADLRYYKKNTTSGG